MLTPPARLPRAGRLISAVALSAVLLVSLAACSGGTSTPPASSPPASNPPPSSAPSLSPAPTVGTIDHKTGAADAILRMETGGGFVPIDFLASQAPTFSLFGNGIIVFQPKVETFREPDANGVVHGIPWRTAKLDEDQIQELLAFAFGPGGLGTARESYVDGGVADAPSTIFTIRAGGLDKTVTINPLFDPNSGMQLPDPAARAAFWKLAQRLSDFDNGGSISTDVYHADSYRGVLIQSEPQVGRTPIAWPWSRLMLSDFTSGVDGSGPTSFPHRVLTSADVGQLGVDDVEGGLQGLLIAGSDGKPYSLVVRPLLADETE